MTITDRQNLDFILGEQKLSLSGDFSDDQYISVGKMTNAQYLLAGTLTRLPQGYMLELAISNIETSERVASFGPRMCGTAEVEGMGVVKEAAAELLDMLGVKLTDAGKSSLLTTNVAKANAESALARGVIAQRSGSSIEAMANYYEAAELDPTLLEATGRLDTLGEAITSGNIGENIRNDIQRRQAWIDLMANCENYFKEHLPCEIIYDDSEREPDRVDYQRNTAEYSYPIAIKPTSQWQIVNQILTGFIATKRGGQWGIVNWPLDGHSAFGEPDYEAYAHIRYITYQNNANGLFGGYRKIVRIEAVLRNSAGQIIAATRQSLGPKVGFPSLDSYAVNYDDTVVYTVPATGTLRFGDVRVDEILDPLSVEIVSVDGRAIDGYTKVYKGDATIDMRPYIRELDSYAHRLSDDNARTAWKAEKSARTSR
jgi:hypothetical protein